MVYRKKNEALHSIEKVFSILLPHISSQYRVSFFFMPFYSSSFRHIVANMRAVKKVSKNLCHVTGDVHYAVLALNRKRTILTIHDNVFMERSSGLRKLVFKWLYLKWPVFAATVVTTISEKSKEEIVRYTGCSKEKIIVIPNAVEKQIYYRQKTFNSHKPMMLFIGSTPNKNLVRAIAALSGISCVLMIIGTVNEEQKILLNTNHIDYRTEANITDQQMADYYAESDLVFVSIHL